jgi:hypothetical protein
LCETYELVGPGLLIIPRDAVGKLGQEDEEEDEEDSEESSEEEDERAERGREVVEEKRSQSLDRELRPSVSPGQGGRMRTVLPSSNSKDPFRPGTIREERGGMTMGRGKQPRGTMLWSSDAPPVPELHPEPEQIDDAGLALARTESTETAVHVGPEDEVEEEKPVPKDEIEMLEDEGKIPVESSMAPLPQQTPEEATPEQVEEMREGEEDGMEEVKLEDEVVPEEAEASETAQVDEIPDQTAPEQIESFDDSPPTPAASTGQEVPVKNGEASGEVAKPAEAEEVDKANDEAREAI